MTGYDDRWEIYEDMGGLWFWKRLARNGETVGRSYKGFASEERCVKNARLFVPLT